MEDGVIHFVWGKGRETSPQPCAFVFKKGPYDRVFSTITRNQGFATQYRLISV